MKKILVGLDGSPRERSVLRAAGELAAKLDAELILFRAITLAAELPPETLAMSPDAIATFMVDAARRQLGELAPPGRARVRVDLGSPWHALCDAARDESADLIVIGSHGYGGIDRLIGTTAAKVVDHARCSVLVVRSA